MWSNVRKQNMNFNAKPWKHYKNELTCWDFHECNKNQGWLYISLVGGNEAWSEIIQMKSRASNGWSRTRQHPPQLFKTSKREKKREKGRGRKEKSVRDDCLILIRPCNVFFFFFPWALIYVRMSISFCGSDDIESRFLQPPYHALHTDFKFFNLDILTLYRLRLVWKLKTPS